MNIIEDTVLDLFYEGKVVERALVGPLFLKMLDKTYAVKGHIHPEVACKFCVFHGSSCPRTLDGRFLCNQLEVSNGSAYFEDVT